MSAQAAIITGGAKRIGAAIALYFADKGYDIALHYNHSISEAQNLKHQIEDMGRVCALFPCDFRDNAAIPSLMSDIHRKFPYASTLVNNASTFQRVGFMETTPQIFDEHFTVNCKAPFFLTQEFSRLFLPSPAPLSVVNMLDTDISQTGKKHFSYLLSKKTMAEITKMSALALAGKARVNAICAGITLPADDKPNHDADHTYMQNLQEKLPLGENVKLSDIAQMAYSLGHNPVITGQLIFVDSGKHLL